MRGPHQKCAKLVPPQGHSRDHIVRPALQHDIDAGRHEQIKGTTIPGRESCQGCQELVWECLHFLPVTEHKHTHTDQQSLGVGSLTPRGVGGQRVRSMNLWRPSHHAARADWMLVVLPIARKKCTSCFAMSPTGGCVRTDGAIEHGVRRGSPTTRLVSPTATTFVSCLIEFAKPLGLCRCGVRILALVQSTLLPCQTHRLGGVSAADVKKICADRLLFWS